MEPKINHVLLGLGLPAGLLLGVGHSGGAIVLAIAAAAAVWLLRHEAGRGDQPH